MFSICDNTATKQLLAKQISVLETYFIGQPTLSFVRGSWGRNCFVYFKKRDFVFHFPVSGMYPHALM